MELLIVDDEKSAVQAVLQGVCWEHLKFTQIFTASNSQEAIEQIEKHDISVLLCDIEMPMGTGLELLEWVNAHKPGICCVFMTCHADFSFAQQALHLGSFEYILKPLDFANLERVLNDAARKVEQNNQMKKASDYWEKGHKAAHKQFWRELFNGDIEINKETISNYIQRNQLDIPMDGQFVPVLVSPRLLHENLLQEDKPLFGFALRNVTDEVFQMKWAGHDLEALSGDLVLVMLTARAGVSSAVLLSEVRQRCRELSDAVWRYLKTRVCCYVGNVVSITEIPGQIEQLCRMDFNNVIASELLIFGDLPDDFMRDFKYSDFIKDRYEKYHGSYAQIFGEIGRILDKDSSGIFEDKAFRKQFFQGFYYMLTDFSLQNNVFMRDLVAANFNRDLLRRAEASADALVEWVKYIAGVLQEFELNGKSRQTPVSLVKEYIKEHMDEELTADKLAAQVHLNSDYLNRIFKKETGMTISKYTIRQKMERAQWLLRHTDLPISEVAAAVGYYNYSSFNRCFSKQVGKTPQEWKFGN